MKRTYVSSRTYKECPKSLHNVGKDEISEAVPNQAYTPQQLLTRSFAQKEVNISGKSIGYADPNQVPENDGMFDKMDKIDKLQFVKSKQKEIDELQRQYNENAEKIRAAETKARFDAAVAAEVEKRMKDNNPDLNT